METFRCLSDHRQWKPCRRHCAGPSPEAACNWYNCSHNAARGGCRRALAGTQWTADGTAGRRGHIPDDPVAGDKAVGVASALPPACEAVVALARGVRSMRPPTPRRLLSLQTFTKGAAWIFANPLFLETDDESLRPHSKPSPAVFRARWWADSACRAGAPRGGFACNFVNHILYAVGEASSAARAPSTYSNRSGAARRSTPPPGRRQTGPPCATSRHTWHATVHCSPPTD